MKRNLGRILFLIIMILTTNISFVMAKEEICKLMLSANGNGKVEEVVELSLKVRDINVETGIAAISGLLVYDEEVFEEVTYKEEEWGILQGLENVIFITTTNMEATTKDSNVLTIRLKTKKDVKPGEYKIKFTQIEVVEDDGTVFNLDDIETEIELNSIDKQNKDDKNSDIENNKDSNKNDNKDTNKENNKKEVSSKTALKTNNLTDTVSSKLLPKTGLKYGITIILMAIAILVGILFYKKYNKV